MDFLLEYSNTLFSYELYPKCKSVLFQLEEKETYANEAVILV